MEDFLYSRGLLTERISRHTASPMEMSRYQTALQSFSIESLIGGERTPVEPCPRYGRTAAAKDMQTADTATADERYGSTSDDDDFRDDRVRPVAVPTCSSPLRDAAEVTAAVQRRQLSTFFNIMMDTAAAQQHPESEPSVPLNIDYLKVLRMQSAAAAAAAVAADAVRKTFSAQTLWPYSNDVSAVSAVPPRTTIYRCADDADSDDAEGHVSPDAACSGSSSRRGDNSRFGESISRLILYYY